MFLLLVLLACDAKRMLSFKPLFSASSRPIFGSVCPTGTEFHVLLSDRTLMSWNGTKASSRPILDPSVYGVVCHPKGLAMLRSVDGIEYVDDRIARGHVYWHAWGVSRPFLSKSQDQYVLLDSALYKSGEDEALEKFDRSVYGCSISFHTGRVKCNTDPYSALIHMTGTHGLGPHTIKLMSMHEGTPAIVLYERAEVSPEHIESDIPPDAEQIRAYSNALGKIYCSYLTRDDGYDTYVITQLESVRSHEVNEL